MVQEDKFKDNLLQVTGRLIEVVEERRKIEYLEQALDAWKNNRENGAANGQANSKQGKHRINRTLKEVLRGPDCRTKSIVQFLQSRPPTTARKIAEALKIPIGTSSASLSLSPNIFKNIHGNWTLRAKSSKWRTVFKQKNNTKSKVSK